MYIVLRILLLAILLLQCFMTSGKILKNTSERIRAYNYPVETHEVVTSDGYVIEIFRIPYSPKLQNVNTTRPAVLIQHGIEMSSDMWILNGPDNALPYLLVDSGYDVWLGNQRGNTYGRKNLHLSTESKEFWDFSWNELGILDLPAFIDYILFNTKQKTLHYVGHSQGTTVFFVLMSEKPEYNSKLKTVHLLAPVAYFKPEILPVYIATQIFGRPSFLSNLLEGLDLIPRNYIMGLVGDALCSHEIFQPICFAIINVNGENDPKHFNYTLLPDIFETVPSGASSGQLLHYVQLIQSGFFRQFDYGEEKNQEVYGQQTPPNYNLRNSKAPIRIYYGLNDIIVPLSSINILENSLPNLIDSFRMPFPQWSHLDFAWALEVKELVNDKVIKIMNHFEKTGDQLKMT